MDPGLQLEGLVNFLPSISLKANTSIIVISQSIKALDLKMVIVASSATFHINVRCNNKSECTCCDGVGCHVLAAWHFSVAELYIVKEPLPQSGTVVI